MIPVEGEFDVTKSDVMSSSREGLIWIGGFEVARALHHR